jgi:hypothetical protein
MWERSPTARLLWGLALAVLLLGFVPAAIGSGEVVWVGVALVVASLTAAQLLMAGERKGRLWDSPLTKLLYAYIAAWGLYVFGSAAIETGSATAIVALIVLTALISLQLIGLVGDRGSA